MMETACRRHLYPKGSVAGSGRHCQRCGYQDGAQREGCLCDGCDNPGCRNGGCQGRKPDREVVVFAPASPIPEGHSPLGASSTHRWMNCPGSVALLTALGADRPDYQEAEPDYRRDGVQAHALAAHCLQQDLDAWEACELYPELTAEMALAIQVYLDFARSLPGRFRHVEKRVHRPEFHALFYGTLDFVAISVAEEAADFVDYKHGEGILVEVEGNTQLQYYAYGEIGEDRDEYPDGMTIRLHVCQPRAEHPAGPIRSWATTAGTIRNWAHEILKPAMDRTIHDRYLSVGEWCRFCPAKLVCPAMTSLGDELTYKRGWPLDALEPDVLGTWYEKAQRLKMLVKAIEEETEHRVLQGVQVAGVKAVNRKAWRIWKDGAPLADRFGVGAYKDKTPSEIDALPGGKDFTAQWAYNSNEGKLSVALIEDRRRAVHVAGDAEKYAGALEFLDKNACQSVEVTVQVSHLQQTEGESGEAEAGAEG